jgi:hypothetical protein
MADVLERGGDLAARAALPRLLTGDDLISELGLTQGPLIGRVLAGVEEAIATGEIESRDAALAQARELLRTLEDESEDEALAAQNEPSR